MQLSVKGKHIDVGDALRQHVSDALGVVVSKYFSNPIEANVVFSREAHLYRADISVHAGRGVMLQSVAEAGEPYPAFDAAAERMANRLRRYKHRLRDHHAPDSTPGLPASAYILEGGDDSEADAGDESPAAEAQDGQPVIIAEMTTQIDTLTVSEAVMRMDLGELPALMFRNRKHGGLNLVYRRNDGHIGWIDPNTVAAAKV